MQVAWGIDTDGNGQLLACQLGNRESTDAWKGLGHDLIGRGLEAPQLVVTDGAPGLIRTVEELWPSSDRQRCCVHRLRNIQAKLPKVEHERTRLAFWKARDDADNVAAGRDALHELASTLAREGYQSAAECQRPSAFATISTRW